MYWARFVADRNRFSLPETSFTSDFSPTAVCVNHKINTIDGDETNKIWHAQNLKGPVINIILYWIYNLYRLSHPGLTSGQGFSPWYLMGGGTDLIGEIGLNLLKQTLAHPGVFVSQWKRDCSSENILSPIESTTITRNMNKNVIHIFPASDKLPDNSVNNFSKTAQLIL